MARFINPLNIGGVADTVPFNLYDSNEDLLLEIYKSGTGTTRIHAPQDDISIRSANDIILYPGDDGPGNVYINWGDATYTPNSPNRVATMGDVNPNFIPLPNFLTYVEGREQLPILNKNFGWDSNGIWFGPTNNNSNNNESYPIFTDFTIPQNTQVQVEFDMEVTDGCNDVGVAIYVDGTVPQWYFGSNETRIAGQFNCSTIELNGLVDENQAPQGLAGPGTYHIRFTYLPLGGTKVEFEVFSGTNTDTLVSSVTLDQVLGAGNYRIGFASDNDRDARSHIENLQIEVGTGQDQVVYQDSLTSGNSGELSLVAPLSIKDSDNQPLITFQKSYTGTARIVAPQDDLALRSARDIILYPGDNGPGEVYIGWGDATYTPNSPNRVATVGYVDTYSVINVSSAEPMVGTETEIGALLYSTVEGNATFVIPTNANVAIPIGSKINFATDSVSTWFIEREDEGTMTLAADGGNGYTGINDTYPYIIPVNSTGTLLKVDTNAWILSGMRLTD